MLLMCGVTVLVYRRLMRTYHRATKVPALANHPELEKSAQPAMALSGDGRLASDEPAEDLDLTEYENSLLNGTTAPAAATTVQDLE